jgi:hypothetical protein
MATFYILPPRECLDRAVSELFGKLLPGLPVPADGWAVLSEHIAEIASWPADLFLIPRDDLPDGERLHDALASGFGAEEGDRVVEVRLAGAPRASVVGVSGVVAAR